MEAADGWSALARANTSRPLERRRFASAHRDAARRLALTADGVAIPARPIATPRAVPFPLIGRERELGDLRTALDDALTGNGRVVLLSGEPGIGKTRLASAIAGEAETRGIPVWWGRAWEDGSAPAFWPWSTALRRWVDRSGRDAAVAAAGPWSAELAHVFPVLRDCIPNLPAGETSESDGARFRLFDLVSRFLAALAKPAGLVLVLDDMHWADAPSLKLLEFVASALGESRVLVVATYRDNEVRREDPLFGTLSRLAREPIMRRLAIEGLSAAYCARWIASTGKFEVDDPAALGEALHRETNGNPFFLGEIVHLLANEEDLAVDLAALRVPHGARDVIARRLDRLGGTCRGLLSVAALLGDTIDAAILAELLGSAPASEHIERAVRDRILIEVEGRRGYYAFAHALIRRALLDDVPAPVRTAWHLRIATVLERRGARCDLVTTELVHHLAAAGTPEALRKAFDHACQGARQAAHGLGWEEAVRLYGIALDVGRRSGLLDVARTLELELELARALRGAGDVPASRARCASVLATCRRIGSREAFARAALIHAGPIPEWGKVDPAVRAVLEEACRLAPALDDGLRARLYARLAGDLIAANDAAQGTRLAELCDEALAAARRAGDPGALAIAFLGTYTASVMELSPPSAGGALPTCEEALAAADESGEHEYAAFTRYLRAMRSFANGESERFAREVDEVTTSAAASRVPEAVWLADALAALHAIVQGRFAQGREAMERALATGRRAQLANALGVYAGQLLMWHVLQGRLAEITAELDFFVEASAMGAGWRPLRALARLASGDAVAARVEYQSLAAAGIAPTERGVMARSYLAGMAALCIALRDRAHAPMLYERMARRDDAWSIGGGNTLGPWPLLLGGLARLCDRSADAVVHLESAIQLGRRMGSSPIVARAQSQLASILLSMEPTAEKRARAAELLDDAARCAQEIGLVDVSARVARLQAKLAQAPRRVAAPNVLRHEGDVWTVCFGGRDLRVKDGKGPRYLAALLTTPGREIHVLELAGGNAARGGIAAASEGLTLGAGEAALDDAPDARAAREYRKHLDDLRAELENAEEHNDAGRAEALRAELDFLVRQLAQRFGGRARTRGLAETARKAVTKVLRTQIVKLLETHPPLGEHLRASVKMGTFCSYAPSAATAWEIVQRA